MLRTRVIPCLQLIDESLVKAVKFNEFNYIGDPANTVRIFNELEVDELCFLDIRASLDKRTANFRLLQEIADECFMPLSYGGGIADVQTAVKILALGYEKIILNTAAYLQPQLITEISSQVGSQSVIVSIDVKKTFLGKYHMYIKDGTEKVKTDPLTYAKLAEDYGAGEILLTGIEQEGTWSGYDTDIIKKISKAVEIPLIANGGAGTIDHMVSAKKSGASALAVGSMVVYQSRGMGVLINFPDKEVLEESL